METVDVSEPTLVNASNDADYVWDANNIVVATTEQKRIEQTIPAAHFVFAYETAPTLPLTGFSVAAPLAPGKYAAVWTLVDLATPPSYGTANCAACGYSLVPLTPRRVETAPDETTPRLVSAAPYQLRGTWQNNGFSLLTPTIPAGVCTGSFAACVTQNFPPYQSLIPSVRVTVGF